MRCVSDYIVNDKTNKHKCNGFGIIALMSATLEITLDGLVRRYLISDEFF